MLEKNDLKAIAELVTSNEEHMFKRFDRVDKCLEDIDKHFGDIDKGFEQIDKRFEQIDKGFEQIDKRFEQIDKRFEEIDKRFEEIDKRFEQIDKYLGIVDKRFNEIDKKFERITSELESLKEMDRFILEETFRVQNYLQKQITELQNHTKVVDEYYRIHKLDSDTLSIVVKTQEELKKRITIIEEKLA